MQQQCDLLVQVRRVVGDGMCADDLLFVSNTSLHVIELGPLGLDDYLGRVVEEDTSRAIGQQIAETVLLTVVDPLLDPYARSIVSGLHHWRGDSDGFEVVAIFGPHSRRLAGCHRRSLVP